MARKATKLLPGRPVSFLSVDKEYHIGTIYAVFAEHIGVVVTPSTKLDDNFSREARIFILHPGEVVLI